MGTPAESDHGPERDHLDQVLVPMDSSKAFAAIALAAVSWDGTLTQAGSRSLRHALDYRQPFATYPAGKMVSLMDELLQALRQQGAQRLMVTASEALNPQQRRTAYAMAAEIMRSDGPYQDDELNILSNLAEVLMVDARLTNEIQSTMNLLHGELG
ncbi:hypothetical protein RS9917_00392 [Synechococcus sp. RS9917]|nr:hypothetical protein RS9917_00392 [Synechococcus sp. RS9917]